MKDEQLKELQFPVPARPDWIKCIAHTHADHLGQPWCGAASTVFFQNLDHAAYAIKNKSLLVPCPECLEAARKQLAMP